MTIKALTDEEKEFLYNRGPISELQLVEWELERVSITKRVHLDRQCRFLRAFAISGIIMHGCKAAGVSRGAVVVWRRDSEWFSMLYELAIEEAADRIEAEAIRRAVDGYDEPVLYQGMPTYVIDPVTGEERQMTVRKYSDQLMSLVLRGARPSKYRENHKVEVESTSGGVLIVPGVIDPVAWAEAAKAQQAKYAGNEGDTPE